MVTASPSPSLLEDLLAAFRFAVAIVLLRTLTAIHGRPALQLGGAS